MKCKTSKEENTMSETNGKANNVSHTPTPWTCVKHGDTIEIIGGKHGGERILADVNYGAGEPEAIANAESIVRAVNSHEALLEAAKIGLSYMTPEEKTVYAVDRKTVEKAIAQAEGKGE